MTDLVPGGIILKEKIIFILGKSKVVKIGPWCEVWENYKFGPSCLENYINGPREFEKWKMIIYGILGPCIIKDWQKWSL